MFEGKRRMEVVSAARKTISLLSIGLALSLAGSRAYGLSSSTEAAQQNIEQDPRSASSDRNLAESMLYQWWGPFEAPDGKAFLPYIDYIFAPDAALKMGAVELEDRKAIRASLQARPLKGGTSHQMRNVEVTALGNGLFQIDADFVYQVRTPDGSVASGNSSYRHTVEKQPDGTFRFNTLTAQLGEPISGAEFQDSFALHRAQGAIVQYLGVTDLLESDYIRLQQVLSDDAVITGMFDPAKQTFNTRGDGSLIGNDEITYWLSSRKDNFAWVAHQLKSINIVSRGDKLFQAEAQVDVQAQPHVGDVISISLPISFMLEETGDRFMKITRIDR